ncbi:MAG: DUF5060 domain-containing protein [Cyanobacteria bacterium P01_F01_bin.86]
MQNNPSVSGELKTWHKVSIDFEAPETFQENKSTFRDYRLDVTFTNASTGEVVKVPGFFAADGDAANTSATEGNIWRVNFNPPSEGDWTYEASFRTGTDVAASTNPNAGQAVDFIDGDSGTLKIAPTDKTGEDFRAKGMLLQGEDSHYLQFQGDGDYFVRGGPGVPENFLANKDIDNTQKGRHDYSTHADEFNPGDPVWGGGKGENLLGSINYLAEQGQNTIYIVTNTAGGDGKDVWPWASEAFGNLGTHKKSLQDAANSTQGLTVDDFSVFDVSKLSQWEILFDHMDEQGIYKNILFQETENDQLLDGGTPVAGSSLSVERTIYMREMIARFGHSNGIQWNMGEENTNSDQERVDMAEYIKAVDGYDHLTTIHTFPGDIDKVYNPLVGVEAFDGTSFQTGGGNIRRKTQEYLEKSAQAGDPWVLSWDEDSSNRGIFQPGGNNPDDQNEVLQRQALWGFFTAGGSGVNWYIKNSNGHSFDQNVDTFDDFESVWQWTAAATEFFNDEIPFWEMSEADNLTPSGDDYVMAKDGEYYVAYRPYGDATNVKLDLNGQAGETFDVFWYNPREGGDLIKGKQVDGGSVQELGSAPTQNGKDWVVFARNTDLSDTPGSSNPPPPSPSPEPTPEPTPGNGAKVFLAENGQLIFEAESAKAVGDWQQTTVDGEKSLLWDAAKSSYGKVPEGETLTYQFETDEAGTYRIALHSGRVKSVMNGSDRYENGKNGQERTDTGNDAYVAIINAETGEVVQKPTKLFTGLGSADRDLKWGNTFDANHKKSPAQVNLDADTQYRLEISGRSDGYVLDRITLSNDGFLRDTEAPESPLKGSTPTQPPEPEPPVPPAPEPPAPPTPEPVPPTPEPPTPEPPTNGQSLIKFALVDAETDTFVKGYEDLGADSTLNLDELDLSQYNIVAKINPDHPQADSIKSVKFESPLGNRVENIKPYAAFGDTDGDFYGKTLNKGSFTLKATAYTQADGKGQVVEMANTTYDVVNAAPSQPTGDAIGQYGTLDLNHEWKTVSLGDTYDNPVVIVSDPTFNGSAPAAIRLRNVGKDSFQVRLQEPSYADGTHINESVSYVVMESGDWKLSDGTRIAVGTRSSNRLTSAGFDTVDLKGFQSAPTVLSQVQSSNGADWVTTRTQDQSAQGFQFAMQEEEALNKGTHVNETVGWLAIDQGIANDGDTLLQAETTGKSYTDDRATVNFEKDFDTAPSVIAKLGSFAGGDTANLRLDDITTTSFGVGVHEEKSLDDELNHINEAVSFIALEGKSGVLTGTSF